MALSQVLKLMRDPGYETPRLRSCSPSAKRLRQGTPGYLQVSQHVDSTLGVAGGYRANLIAKAMKLDIDARIAYR